MYPTTNTKAEVARRIAAAVDDRRYDDEFKPI